MTFAAFEITGQIGYMKDIHIGNGKKGIKISLPERIKSVDSYRIQWHTIFCWNDKAEFAREKLAKGSIVHITCSISYGKDHKAYFSASSIKLIARRTRRKGAPAKYRRLIRSLKSDVLYTPATLSYFAKERSHLQKCIRRAMIETSRSHRFPPEGDGLVFLKGQHHNIGWFGWRWKRAYTVKKR